MILYYLIISLTPFANAPLFSRFLGDSSFKVIGGICAFYAIYYLFAKGSMPSYFRTWQVRVFVLFFILAAVSYWTKGLQAFHQSTFLIYTDFALFLFLTVSLVDSLKRLRWALFSAIAGIAYGSAHVILEWWSFRRIFAGYRAGMSVGDGNYFATSAVLGLPFAFFMMFHAKKRWERYFYRVSFPLILVSIMLTGSRGGFVALGVTFLLVVWFSPRRTRNLVLVSALATPLLVLLPASPLNRFLHPDTSDRESEQSRLTTWAAGIRMFESHPIAGIGLGNFEALVVQYEAGAKDIHIAHNTYIELAAEMGFVAPILFMGILLSSIISLEKVRKRCRQRRGPPMLYLAALSLEAGLIGYMAGAFFLSAEYQKLFWMVIFFSICLPRLARWAPPAIASETVEPGEPALVEAGNEKA